MTVTSQIDENKSVELFTCISEQLMCIKMLTFSDSPDCRVRYAVLSDVINGIIVIRIDEAGIPNCVIGSTITSIPLKTFFVTFDTDENKTIRLLGPI